MDKKIISREDLKNIRKENKSIALCSGCFDVVHSGHAYFFKQCKEFADVLVVSLGSDRVIKQLKGEGRPINNERRRIYLLSAMQDIDYVVLGEEEMKPGKIDFYNIISELKPDIFILNENDSALKEKKELCDLLGVTLRLVPRIVPYPLDKTSSTEIIKNTENDPNNPKYNEI
jgi:rfaE bifunctional protein nucleotidyltransferase chain/domain